MCYCILCFYVFKYEPCGLSLRHSPDYCYGLKILYDTSDNLESVELTPPTRRSLAAEENDAAAIEGRRLEFDDCTACEDAWVSLCSGASSVCDLVDHGSPLSTAAAASIDTMCGTFGSACSIYEASEACQDQCTDEGLSHQYTTFLGSPYIHHCPSLRCRWYFMQIPDSPGLFCSCSFE